MAHPGKRIALIIVLMLVVFLAATSARRAMHASHENSYEFPMVIEGWKGETLNENIEFLRAELGAQSILFRTYTDENKTVTMYLAYYKDVNSANRVHAPTVCYPGQGWAVKSDDEVSLKFRNNTVHVNRLIVEKGKKRELVYNWWQTGDRILPRNSWNRFYQMFRSVTGQNPSTVWVRLSQDIAAESGSDERAVSEFSKNIMPLVTHYFVR